MNKAINLHRLQDSFFAQVVERCVQECVNHFEGRLVAVYVWGSVHRQEAVRGISDLDLIVFVTDTNQADREWRNDYINDQLEKEFPDVIWGSIPHPSTLDEISHDSRETESEQEKMWRRSAAHLLHNATLVFGRDLTTKLPLSLLDKSFARWALSNDLLKLARYAAGLVAENQSDFELPNDPSLKLRKLARSAVLGGAFLLMAQGRYKSDRGSDVLPLLMAENSKWTNFLQFTRAKYMTPGETTAAQVSEYSHELVSWLEWIQKQLD